MKLREDAKKEVIVAGGQGHGSNLTQLSYPHAFIVDQIGHLLCN